MNRLTLAYRTLRTSRSVPGDLRSTCSCALRPLSGFRSGGSLPTIDSHLTNEPGTRRRVNSRTRFVVSTPTISVRCRISQRACSRLLARLEPSPAAPRVPYHRYLGRLKAKGRAGVPSRDLGGPSHAVESLLVQRLKLVFRGCQCEGDRLGIEAHVLKFSRDVGDDRGDTSRAFGMS